MYIEIENILLNTKYIVSLRHDNTTCVVVMINSDVLRFPVKYFELIRDVINTTSKIKQL